MLNKRLYEREQSSSITTTYQSAKLAEELQLLKGKTRHLKNILRNQNLFKQGNSPKPLEQRRTVNGFRQANCNGSDRVGLREAVNNKNKRGGKEDEKKSEKTNGSLKTWNKVC